MDGFVTFLAKYLIIVPAVVTIYMLWSLKGNQRKKFLILLIAGGIISLIVAKIAGHIYVDPRPAFKDNSSPLFHAGGYNGFPSDHTLLASFLGFAIVRFSRRWGWLVLLLAVIIGWARVAGHVHHFVDILGSFIITAVVSGIVWGIIEARGAKTVHHQARQPRPDHPEK